MISCTSITHAIQYDSFTTFGIALCEAIFKVANIIFNPCFTCLQILTDLHSDFEKELCWEHFPLIVWIAISLPTLTVKQ